MNTRTSLPAALAALTSLVLPTLCWGQNEVGFIERFALAADREKALGELVPGSEDYYFFHALHYQNTRNEAKLAEILNQWRARFPDEREKRRIIENREALLDYDTAPQTTLAYLKEQLGVDFHHQQEARGKKPDLPVKLDPANIAWEVFLKRMLAPSAQLGGVTHEAMEQLVANKVPLTPQQRQIVLQSLQHPDVPNLLEFIAEELRDPGSKGFQAHGIHSLLLLEQLDTLAKMVPNIATQEAFVFTRLRKLAPGADVDIETDAAEREAWLERVWAYAKTLPSAFNTVKAQILFRRLEHDRKKGTYDTARLLEYLKLPRRSGYVNPTWLSRAQQTQPVAQLTADLSVPLLTNRPIGNDEEMVRDYLMNIFRREALLLGDPARAGKLYESYSEYVSESWAKALLAEVLITAGVGKPEQWATMLSPQAFQRLKDRVDIEFPQTNAEQFALGQDVSFDVTVKNTPKLMVRIYELNALNFFQAEKRQLNTDVNLDGLVANSERTESFEGGPFLRTTRKFTFPELKGRRGAWIIEFIGGGRSSRALVRVGQWHVLQQVSPGGDLLTVLDEQGELVKDAAIWVDGRKLTPQGKLGHRIVVPFTSKGGMRPLIITDAGGTFATLTQFEQHEEDYRLDAKFHFEREQLLARRTAALGVRVSLLLHDSYIAPELLKETRLLISFTTLDGIQTTKEFRDLKLTAGGILTQEVTVPERVAKVSAQLIGTVSLLSQGGSPRELRAEHTWMLNGIDATPTTLDGHLSKFGNEYVFQLLGKNGEPLTDQAVNFKFYHRSSPKRHSVTLALKTDAKGRIALGSLTEIHSVEASIPNLTNRKWELYETSRTAITTIHTGAGQPIPLPINLSDVLLQTRAQQKPAQQLISEVFSLLELRNGTPVWKIADKIVLKDGDLQISGLTPGDYQLRIPKMEQTINIRVSGGKASQGWYLGAARHLQAKAEKPLFLRSVVTDGDFVTVKLANVTPFTRVHIAASYFDPGLGMFGSFASFVRFDAHSVVPAQLPNLYSTGRSIGDEYRYILERRQAQHFPGNMLTRPGLILNPWETRDTTTMELQQQVGEGAGRTRGERALSKNGGGEAAPSTVGDPFGIKKDGPNLDFLAKSAPVLYNLIPNKDGTVKIPRAALGDRQHMQVYAEDLGDAVWRSFALAEQATPFVDLRLAKAIEPTKPSIERKDIQVLQKGGKLEITDILTSELETYDTLAEIHSLFTTLSGDARLAEFAWLLQWPKLKDEEKRAKYSEFACHELHLFLSKKDPAFFNAVVKPYLANKKERTFLDEYLLDADLSRWLEPHAFSTLNTAERALLAIRIKASAAAISRGIREAWELLPPNLEDQDRLFETALRGREMDVLQDNHADFAPTDGMDNLKPEDSKRRREVKTFLGFAEAKELAKSKLSTPAPAAPSATSAPISVMKPATGVMTGRSLKADESLEAGLSLRHQEASALVELSESDKLMQEKLAREPETRRRLAEFKNRADDLKRQGLGDDRGDANLELVYFGAAAAGIVQDEYRALFRPAGVTKEWAENHYYKLRITEQTADLVPVNAFWRDFANHIAQGTGPFVSPHVAEAAGSFAEMMLALAVLDLPFDAGEHATQTVGNRFTITAASPVILYHKKIETSPAPEPGASPLLVSQSFFNPSDRYRQEGSEQVEKHITGEFLTGTVYGANVVVTNASASPVKGDVLLQIPQGALPVNGSRATRSQRVHLAPYTTQTIEYFFYFPAIEGEGKTFPHFPVNAAVKGAVVAAAKPATFKVVTQLSQMDTTSWAHISQYGTEAEIFAFLEKNNLPSIDISRVAWRCKDAAFFKKLTAFLRANQRWDETIYSYALLHNDAPALREWLRHKDAFLSQCGPYLSSQLILLDPIERRTYEQLEYSPLINQRAHRIGADWRIANPAVREQYTRLLDILAHKPRLDAMDHLSTTYHLFLQDRVEEGLARFRSVDPQALPTRIQHDYFRCYAAFYEGNLAEARNIAAQYAAHPVARWKSLFAEVSSQLDEIEGKAAAKADKPDRDKAQNDLATSEPSFDFKVEKQTLNVMHRNLGEITVNYYLMDPEFSFSSNPFVSLDTSRFSIIRPSKSTVHPLPKEQTTTAIPLPAEYARANVLIEIIGAGQRKAQAYHANTLTLTLAENYGRLEATDAANGKPIPRAYVKVYARLKNGTVRFYKDGYTDLRGRFDYASINADKIADAPGLDRPIPALPPSPAPINGLDYQMLKPGEQPLVEKLSLLLLSETHGATTREIAPPAH